MKPYLPIVATLIALISCNKVDFPVSSNPSGELVTIRVDANTDNGTKVSTELNLTSGEITFKWEEGDQLKITRNGQSNTFTLKSGKGATSGEFEGIMPGTSGMFDVQFPVSDPDLSTQEYVVSGLPHNLMKATATGCSLEDESITLTPQYAALRLNLYGDSSIQGINDQSIGSIKIELDGELDHTYSLNCIDGEGKGVQLGDSDNTSIPFLIVVHPGTYSMKATIFGVDSTNYKVKFSTTGAKTFTAGETLNMTSKYIDWASTSCLAAGTKITMADGSTKKVEDIVEGDLVMTFDHEAGQLSSAIICLALQEEGQRNPLTLHFASGNALTIAGQHGLLEQSARKYVLIHTGNVKQYVGKSFYNAQTGTWDKLLSYEIGSTPVDRYAIYSAKHLNVIAENMLTVEDDVDFILNIYELDINLKADAAQLTADIVKYGIFDITQYDPAYAQYKEQMDNLGGKYVYIAIGKGLVPEDYIKTMKSYWTGK